MNEVTKRVGLKAIFLVALTTMLILLSNCITISNHEVLDGGVNLCTSSISTFSLDDEEKSCVKRETKENMAHINCALYKYCGFKVSNPTFCDYVYEQESQE